MSRINQRISNLIKDQLPEFLTVDHELFVAFIEAYYKFLEQDQNALEIVQNARSYNDIDTTITSFVSYFLNTYAKDIPTSSLLNKTILIKRIKDLYESKGSQLSFQTLFRIFYNTSVVYKHPYDNVLKPSDGNWSQRVSIHVEESEGDGTQLENKYIYLEKNGITYRSQVERVKILTNDRYEIFLQTNQVPPFEIGDVVYSSNTTHSTFIGNVIPTITDYSILQPGLNLRAGQIINVNEEGGVESLARITQVDSTGGVIYLDIINYGYGYTSNVVAGYTRDSSVPVDPDPNTYSTLWGWGAGENYNTGRGSLVDKYLPETDPKGTGVNTTFTWKDIGKGGTAAIKNDGTLWTWGDNLTGTALQPSTVANVSIPTQAPYGNTWSSIIESSTTYVIGAGIKTDGTLWTWGTGNNYLTGVGDTVHRSSPVQVSGGGTNWKKVSCGVFGVGAIKTDGTLWTWGSGIYGNTGHGDTITRSVPTQVGSDTTWSTISHGAGHVLAIKTDGTLWAWGWNIFGALGNGSTISRSSPIQIGSSTNWKQVSGGAFSSFAVKNDGSLWAWGANDTGNLGTGGTTNVNTPIQVANTSSNTWSSVYSVYRTTFGIKTDGTLWAWGHNIKGSAGLGILVSEVTTPAQVILPNDSYYDNKKWKKITGFQAGANSGPTIALRGEDYNIDNTVIDFRLGAVGRYPGQYTTNKGFISEPDVKIQDSLLYQPFAYQLTSELDISVFYDTVKKLIHPAGTNLFSNRVIELSANLLGNVQVIISSNSDITLDTATAPTFVTLSDVYKFSLSTGFSNAAVISDVATIALAKATLLENTVITDASVRSTEKAVSDSVTTTDSINTINVTKVLEDKPVIGDALSYSLSTAFSDKPVITDSIIVGYATTLGIDYANVSDSSVISTEKSFTDITSIGDNLVFEISLAFNETIPIGDSVALTSNINIDDSVTITDPVTFPSLTNNYSEDPTYFAEIYAE